jgi:hypothetical protein
MKAADFVQDSLLMWYHYACQLLLFETSVFKLGHDMIIVAIV